MGVLLLGEAFGIRSGVGALCVLSAAILLGLEKDEGGDFSLKEAE
jgi:drug/metabolite transporter (DMT)-like permease